VFSRAPHSRQTPPSRRIQFRLLLAQRQDRARVTALRNDLRNIAIIAHVDHGKTTLVDAMLRQSGTFSAHEAVIDRIMDNNDLEREKGITILAKNAAVRRGDVKINIVDTPGHADFGGEVERGLTMVDGVLLLVDASEGPLPQTRFVLRKALSLHLPVILVVNKIDRQDARVAEVVDETYELFLELDATDAQIEFPIIYTNAKAGTATLDMNVPGENLDPLFDTILTHIPAPTYEEGHPFQAMVTNLDASPYLGRLALCRVREGSVKKGQTVAWCRVDGTIQNAKIVELFVTEALERTSADTAGPGEIIAIAGIPDITIGETLADMADPRPLPVISVDEPSMSMTIGVNSSPLSGQDGDKLTGRLLKSRLDQEILGNVSIKVEPADRPDTYVVYGRGELQLAVLVETMRREGFEMTVGKPEVVTRTIDGKLHEPTERLVVDVPDEHMGAVTRLLAPRRGRLLGTNMQGGRVRLEYDVPARGLIGFHTEFLTETRGTGLMHHVFEGYEPWAGELRTRESGSLVADRPGPATPYAIAALQERSSLFVSGGDPVYEGMIVGENSRSEDMVVNITREKKLTNMRAASADTTVRITPPRKMSLEESLEFIREDECVEVTPRNVRIRKTILDSNERDKASRRPRVHAEV
jgi:GTP-binding protein